MYSGMSVHYAQRENGQGQWCYAERGKSNHHHRHHHSNKKKKYHPTMVFVHGIGADKDMWPAIVRRMPNYCHCIIVDLPGILINILLINYY